MFVSINGILFHVVLREYPFEVVSPVPFSPWQSVVCLELHQRCPKSDMPQIIDGYVIYSEMWSRSQYINWWIQDAQSMLPMVLLLLYPRKLKVSVHMHVDCHNQRLFDTTFTDSEFTSGISGVEQTFRESHSWDYLCIWQIVERWYFCVDVQQGHHFA